MGYGFLQKDALRQGFKHKQFIREAIPGNTHREWGTKQGSEGSQKVSLSSNLHFEKDLFHWQAERQELQRYLYQRAERLEYPFLNFPSIIGCRLLWGH